MAVAGTGPQHAIDLAQDANTAGDIFFGPVRHYYGEWAVTMFNILLCTGSFACGMAFHNCASRYLYALGREGLSTRLQKTIGATHPKHGSPHIASFVQTGVTLVLILAFLAAGMDPYVHMYTLLAILGTMAILIVQALCSIAVIWYFQVRKVHQGNVITTGIIPALGAIGMLYVCYLLFTNLDFAGGAASGSLLFKLIPYIVAATFLIGLFAALYFRAKDPEQYQRIGRTVLEDAHERD